MSNTDVRNRAVATANVLLPFERRIVGVKIAYSKEEFEKFDAVTARAPISYCVAVKSATLGHAVKFTAKYSGCGGSTRALGLARPTESFFAGRDGYRLGLYCSEELSAKVAAEMVRCEREAYGVIVKPLEMFEEDPDVVLIVADTRSCMRVIQGYTYYFGMQDHFCMTGNQAVCVEGTAIPLVKGEINLSMFCSGTRFLAGWKDYEAVVGIPYEKFARTVDGIRMTVNAVEPDERKTVIAKQLEALGYETDQIIPGDAYYLRLEQEKRETR